MYRFTLIVRMTCLSLVVLTWATLSQAKTDLFPRYAVIEPNIAFWSDIYATYPTTRVVIHDSRDLGIVYDVITVKPYDAPGARKINRNRSKRAKAKYRDILRRLAANPGCGDQDCRRVAALFGPGADARTFQQASRRVRSQLGQKDRFEAGLIRSGAYIDEIRRILKSYGVPEDLAYLPHVESSFNPKAYSKFGAAGIWQFTRSTGRRFMKVGYVLDERRDPIRATHAAAQLLKENYARLGSWPLAITAYNHGAAGMARARKKHGDYPAVFQSYRSRTFKFASRNFYAEFLAARQVAANYQAHFGDLVLATPKPSQTYVLKGYARLQDICDHFSVSPDTVRKMNLALRPPVFNDQKYIPQGYRLRLPPGAEEAMLAGLPASLYKAKQKPSRFYTVQKGDTAGRIARNHGVRLSDLILANNLSARATIYPRQTLRIPLPGEKVAAPEPQPPVAVVKAPPVLVAAAEPVEEKEVAKPEEPIVAETVRPESPATPPAAPGGPEVQPVLPEIAPSTVETPEPEPAVTVGTVMIASSPTETTTVIPAPEIVSMDVRFDRVSKTPQGNVGVIQVEVEETLGHYADWAGVRTQRIRRLNGLPFGRTLHLHQKIKIPLDSVSAGAFEEKRYEYHKRLQEDFFAVYRVSELAPYRVERGDNYWQLCREKFDVPMWLLKHYNMDADLAALQIRQELMIPLIEKTAAGDPGTVTHDDDGGSG